MIQVDSLTKNYREFRAVDNISFHVKKGEVVGFLGPNGAGKTTTMKILTCFLPPTEGTARIAGMDIYDESLEIRKRIGYLPENAPLYLDMGVLDYLKYIAEIRQIPREQLKSRLDEIIVNCALQKVVHKDIYELSKGFRQRLGLAQALIHKPDIMILDEPTSGLDPNQIIEIRNLIKEIGKEKTILLSTHILPEVEATCDRVIIISQGKIVAKGTPSELSAGAGKKDITYITIKGPKQDIEFKLQEHQSVTSFKFLESSDSAHRFEVIGPSQELAEELFKLNVENNWVITELRKEAAKLEDVFLQLTRQE